MPLSLWSARYVVFVHECPHGDPGTVEVSVRKAWFVRRTLTTDSREVLRACLPVEAETEPEKVARALEAAAAAMRGREARD